MKKKTAKKKTRPGARTAHRGVGLTDEGGYAEVIEGRNKQWERDGTKMVWLRVTTEQRDRMDAAVRVWNAEGRVIQGRVPKLTRTGLILDAVDAYLSQGPVAARQPADQLTLPGVKRG
jgi:hypothetical protein